MRILAALAISSTLLAPARTEEQPELRRDDEYIRQLLLRAADEALTDRINKLFEIWMRDSTDQPRRFLVGAHQSVNAYREIISALEGQTWRIPPGPVSVFPPALPERPPPTVQDIPPPSHGTHHRRHR